jgi:hypothetical protein
MSPNLIDVTFLPPDWLIARLALPHPSVTGLEL